MSEWPDNYVKVNGLTIHYHRTSEAGKPPVILLHGVSDNGLCWTPVARDLQADYDAIMTDARGHGQTGGSLESFSYKQLAADVAGLIGALGLEKPYLFGHSMGAQTAAVVAAEYPGLVRAVVLEDPPFIDAPPARAQPADEQVEEPFGKYAQFLLRLKTESPEQRLVLARQANPNWDDVELDPWVNSKVEFDLEVFKHFEGAFPWREPLPRISCPILLVTGDPKAGAIVSPQIAQEAASLWQQGQVVQIQGAGHCIHRDRYAETIPQVLDFLSQS